MLDKFLHRSKGLLPLQWRWVFEHEGFNRYFANTSWMFIGQAISLVMGFFVGAYVARYLGPENFGLMNYAISFASLFGFLCGFGVDSILNRELVKHPEKKQELLGAGFWIKFGGGLVAVLIINAVSFFVHDNSLVRTLVLIFSITCILQSAGVIAIFFQSQVLSKKVVGAQTIVALLSTALKVALIWWHADVVWLTATYVFDGVCLGILLLCLYYKHESGRVSVSASRRIIRSLLADSFPLMFAIVFTTIYAKIDQVLVGHLLNTEAVGLYAAAVKLSEIWYVIPTIICASLFPALIHAQKTSMVEYERRLRNLYVLVGGIAVGIACAVFLVAPFIVNLLYGSEYSSVASTLRIYIWSGVPVFLMVVMSQYLLAENYTKIYVAVTMAGAVANIFLNLLWIPRYGINGSAIATLVSYSTVPLVLLFFKKTRDHIVSMGKGG